LFITTFVETQRTRALSLFQGGGGTKKRPKNSKKKTKKLLSLSYISVPCMKIQGEGHIPPAADAHVCTRPTTKRGGEARLFLWLCVCDSCD